MNVQPTEVPPQEQTLVKLYMDLTGATEANARSVYMHLAGLAKEETEETPATTLAMPLT